jgi:hypothetical protein
LLGLEAKSRIWLVLDGQNLYVDKNGNGDLIEAGEKVAENQDGRFPLGKIEETGGDVSHDVEVRRIEKEGREPRAR